MHADKAYDFPFIRVGLRLRQITPRIARRGIESSTRLGRYRWVVEPTLAWLHRMKRLRIREERAPERHLALLQLGCCPVLYREFERRRLLNELLDVQQACVDEEDVEAEPRSIREVAQDRASALHAAEDRRASAEYILREAEEVNRLGAPEPIVQRLEVLFGDTHDASELLPVSPCASTR